MQTLIEERLQSIDPRLLDHPEGRRALTKHDPFLFALLYLPHHLKNQRGDITFSEFHTTLIEHAREWAKPLRKMKEYRDAYVAPRECGKSTWMFLILPMWAASHGHVKFIAAFSDSATQAEQHLSTFKNELDSNELLQADFPELCRPKTRRGNRQIADSRSWIIQDNEFVFMAKGVDSSALGMKVGARRPEIIILDDIEPGESNYSPHQVKKRLATLRDDIFPMNVFARVIMVGTTTMYGSIMHQLQQSRTADWDSEDAKDLLWIKEENLECHYFPAIIDNGDGTERSIWPEKWPIEDLQAIRHTRSFKKNYQNEPVSEDGVFWNEEDFLYGEGEYGNTLLSIDPAVTKTKVSDYTGLAIVSRGEDGKVYVRYSNHVKLGGEELVEYVRNLIEVYGVGLIYVEVNQGGDLWKELFKNLPCKVRTIHQTESKNIRAGKALNYYQRRQVLHTQKHHVAEGQMCSFPSTVNDDAMDAVVSGVLYFLEPKPQKRAGAKQLNYV